MPPKPGVRCKAKALARFCYAHGILAGVPGQHPTLLRARLRETFAAVVPKLDLPELARFQASLDGCLAALAQTLHAAIATTAPKLDLSELAGFERVAEGLASTVSADALAALAASVERVIPAQALNDFASLMGPDIIKWAANLNLGDDLTGHGAEDESKGLFTMDDLPVSHLSNGNMTAPPVRDTLTRVQTVAAHPARARSRKSVRATCR